MIEKVLHRGNMLKAYTHVLANKGSAGVDGMRLEELALHLKQNRDAIATAICNGRYLPHGGRDTQGQRQESPAGHSHRHRSGAATGG
ncbi:hypothetical protein GCM10028895_20540 [Pontibacter rugosus]